MLQSVLLASIEKGQFAVAVLGIVAVVMLLKMQSSDVGRLALQLLDAAGHQAALGYLCAASMLVGWTLHVRYLRRQFVMEIDRVSLERNDAQARCLGSRITSSEDSP